MDQYCVTGDENAKITRARRSISEFGADVPGFSQSVSEFGGTAPEFVPDISE
jgi:hypothetical protein